MRKIILTKSCEIPIGQFFVLHKSFKIILSESKSIAARHQDLGELKRRGEESLGQENSWEEKRTTYQCSFLGMLQR